MKAWWTILPLTVLNIVGIVILGRVYPAMEFWTAATAVGTFDAALLAGFYMQGQNEILMAQNKIADTDSKIQKFEIQYKVYQKYLKVIGRLEEGDTNVRDEYDATLRKANFVFPVEVYRLMVEYDNNRSEYVRRCMSLKRMNNVKSEQSEKIENDIIKNEDYTIGYRAKLHNVMIKYIYLPEFTTPVPEPKALDIVQRKP